MINLSQVPDLFSGLLEKNVNDYSKLFEMCMIMDSHLKETKKNS